jgi:ubiquinone/menaquinone biosynthesis C-methylase UbiE
VSEPVGEGVAGAYSATGAAWQAGPGRVYDRLAVALVARSPVPLRGRLVLDLGAGTGAASRAVATAGGRPVALDAAFGMLAVDRRRRPPAVQGDATRLPVATGAAGGVVAAFSLNHVADPVAALAECRRVAAPGAPVLVSTYAADDDHPVKRAVTEALTEHGFAPPPWYVALSKEVVPRLAEPDRCATAARAAGLEATVEHLRVPFPELGPGDLVDWRLGMAQHVPFLDGLPRRERAAVRARALALLGEAPELVRSVLVLRAVVAG